MPTYMALTYTPDLDWTHPDQAETMKHYAAFGEAAAAVIRGGAALYPTSTATTVRAPDGAGGDVVSTDGPYAESKDLVTGSLIINADSRVGRQVLNDAGGYSVRHPLFSEVELDEVQPVRSEIPITAAAV